MTLIITHVSQRRIFQSGDFRLTDAGSGAAIDYWAQKQIIVQRFRWTALVGFCGIAHTGNEYVPEWIVGQLRATAPDATFDDFVVRLRSAEAWLARANPRFRVLTFSVGAFVDFKPTFVLISNFESIGRPPWSLPTRVPAALEVTRFRPKKEQLFLSGRPAAVPPRERQSLLGTFRKAPTPEQGYVALAEVNRRASARDNTVGPACFTADATVLGDEGGMVHGWPADREYLPAFVDIDGMFLPRLKAATDEHGRPKPIQLAGISGARFESSVEYFRVALEEKPDDPSILSNYGNWLKDRGELDEAEASYRKAIAIDEGFANAHGNLGILLHDRGDAEEAEREYRRAFELDPRSQLHAANLAFFLSSKRGDRDTGEKLFGDALARERDAFTVGRFALFTESALGNQDAVRQLYEEALRIAPSDPWTHGRFADFLRRSGDLEAAREHFEHAVAGDHPDHEALLRFAELEARHGSPGSGVKLLRRALKLRPRDPNALAMLAAARTLVGAAVTEVERMYRQALDWDPDQPLAALNLAQILLRRGGAHEEARQLLLAADNQDLAPEMRLEMLFYGAVYSLAGFEEAHVEICSLVRRGVRIPEWDLSQEIAAAEGRGHPHADLLVRVGSRSNAKG